MTAATMFSHEVIAELRHRVAVHNAALGERGKLKLGKLKGLYKRFYGGHDPRAHALRKIDAHLTQLREKLTKATPPRGGRRFDGGRHPRGQDGEFRATGHQVRQIGLVNRSAITHTGGSGGAGGQQHFFNDVASDRAHRGLQDTNRGYDAFQTQVIPETRYSVFGPPIAGAAGIALGAVSGATASLRGDPLDRAVIAGLRRGGKKLGEVSAHVTAATAVRGARMGARAAIPPINNAFGLHLGVPSPTAGAGIISGARQIGGRVGDTVAHGTGHILRLSATGAPAIARWSAERALGGSLSPRGARIAGRSAGALVGTILPGALLYAPQLHRLMTGVGPYFDAAFPRKVRKMSGSFLDAPEVLAKQHALMALTPLEKANITRLARSLVGVGREFFARHPSVASHTVGLHATGIGPEAASRSFNLRNQGIEGFAVRRNRIGHLRVASSLLAPGAAVGAGVGAIAGAAGGLAREKWEAAKHPRGQHGRFAHSGAVLGAKVGGIAGAGLGLAAGVLAARRGHGHLLAAALARLVEAHPDMREAAQTNARETHAEAVLADAMGSRTTAARALKALKLPPGSTKAHETVRNYIEGAAEQHWLQTEGAAMQGHPTTWYTYQIDHGFKGVPGFETALKKQLVALGEPVPIKGPANTETVAAKSGFNLLNTIDESRLSAGQKRIWDDLKGRRDKAIEQLEQHYTKLSETAMDMEREERSLTAEREKFSDALDYVPKRLRELEGERVDGSLTPISEVRRFAKQHLGIDLPSKLSRADAFEHLHERMGPWQAEINEKINRLSPEIDRAASAGEDAASRAAKDLEPHELEAIPNPFATKPSERFLQPKPAPVDIAARRAAVREAASKEFMTASNAHAEAAKSHLDLLVAAHEAAIKAELPGSGLNIAELRARFPELAAHWTQGSEYAAAVRQANYEHMGPTEKAVHDWAQRQKDPKVAYATAKTLVAWAKTNSKKAGRFALDNWKTLASAMGLASAFGILDVTQPKGKRLNLDRKNWATPGLQAVREFPDPVRRPDEALLGLSYFDRQTKQQRFLTGIHIYSKNGDHTTILPGAVVQDVLARVKEGRLGGRDSRNGGDDNRPLRMENFEQVRNEIGRLKQAGNIVTAQPPFDGRAFEERTGGDAHGKDKEVSTYLYNQHIAWLERNREKLNGKTQPDADRYWDALRSIMSSHGSQILDRRQRVALLIGGGGYPRGLFANNDALREGRTNTEAVKQRLIAQINMQKPRNNQEYHLAWRALWIVGEHFNLDREQIKAVHAHLSRESSQRYRQPEQRDTSRTVPTIAGASATPSRPVAGSISSAEQVWQDIQSHVPEEIRDENTKETVTSFYQRAVDRLKSQHGDGMTDEERHRAAADRTRKWVDDNLAAHKMAKRVPTWDGKFPEQPIAGSAAPIPKIAGAGTFRGDLHAATRAKQVGSQIGSYGLGQAAYEAASHFVPGGKAIRFAASTAAGLGGGAAGYFGGRQVGAALGDKSRGREQSPGEATARGLAGVGGQIVGTKFAGGIAGRAARSTAGTAVNRIAGAAVKGIGQRIGGRIGGWLGGVGGEVAEPAGGGIAGAAVGTAIGTAAGWLTDEGVGLLYRELSRNGYGGSATHAVAQQLGVPKHVRARHGAALGGTPPGAPA